MRMAGCRSHFEIARTERHALAVREITIGPFGAARFRERDRASELALEKPGAGHVIGVNVRLERGDELQFQLADERGVAARLLENRIDQYGLARLDVADEIRIRRRLRIEELAEGEHRRAIIRA